MIRQVTTRYTESLITPREAAIALGVTPRTIAKWCREKRLRAIKINRVWRIRCYDGQPIIEVDL